MTATRNAAETNQGGQHGKQAAGLRDARWGGGLVAPGLVQAQELETFHQAEIPGLPEPERGALLKSGAPTIEVFGHGAGGDRRGAPAQGKPGGGGDGESEGGGGEGMEGEHQPGGHAGCGDRHADVAEGAMPSPLPGECFK